MLLIIPLLIGCSEKTDFTLKGQITGLDSDTLLVYYQVPEYKIDSIFCEKGVFEYTFVPDTTTVFSLILNQEESLPIFAEKGQTVEVKSDSTGISIKGKGDNKLMNEILLLLQETPQKAIMEKVDSLIHANYDSFTNIYLIDKYYAHMDQPNYGHIKELIKGQSGIIRDTPYFISLDAKLNELNKESHRTISSLQGQDPNGKPARWLTTRDKYILVDFWASWHPESVAEQDSLEKVLKALKKEDFIIYSISLDMDKEAWLKAAKKDTLQWRQVCDFKGWNNQLVKNQNIRDLPANLLLDKNKRIINRNIRGQELIDKVKENIKRDKEREKEKERKARKRNR